MLVDQISGLIILIDLTKDQVALDKSGKPVYLSDLWPTNAEIFEEVTKISKQMFQETYKTIFSGSKDWLDIKVTSSQKYKWEQDSTYIQKAPFFEGIKLVPDKISDIKGARVLALLGDSVTTDHISPAGSIKENSPAGKYLLAKGIKVKDFNSYGSRRGNYEVMVRGTFANVRIQNELVPELEGGFTKHIPSEKTLPIYDAAMLYKENDTPLIIVAGKEYGTGSSRDWAAKGTRLLGVQAIIAESFERIHRSNLIGMGILPLQFTQGHTRKTLHISGLETFDVNLTHDLSPRATVKASIHYANNTHSEIELLVCIDTLNELNYYKHGGILSYVLRNIVTRKNLPQS